jgi:hypothetical protein
MEILIMRLSCNDSTKLIQSMMRCYFLVSVKLCLLLVIGFAPSRSLAVPLAAPIETCRILPEHRDFRNLQSLLSRYMNGKNLPIRSMPYLEFSDYLNVLIDEINDRFEQDSYKIDRDDLRMIRLLQERFSPELAILRQRMGLVEVRTACNVD